MDEPGRDDAVALVVSHGLWDHVDHGVEIAWRVAATLPDRPIRWLAVEQDHWLSLHDLRHADLATRVQLVDPAAPDALRGVGILVRTGYSTSAAPTLIAGHDAGLPVVAMRADDLPFEPTTLRPFDVEGLTEEVLRLLETERP